MLPSVWFFFDGFHSIFFLHSKVPEGSSIFSDFLAPSNLSILQGFSGFWKHEFRDSQKHSLKLRAKAPENWWLEDRIPLQMTWFRGRADSFLEGAILYISWICLVGDWLLSTMANCIRLWLNHHLGEYVWNFFQALKSKSKILGHAQTLQQWEDDNLIF